MVGLNKYVVKAVTEIRTMQWALHNSLEEMQKIVIKELKIKSDEELEVILEKVINKIERDIDLQEQFLEANKERTDLPYPARKIANKLEILLEKVGTDFCNIDVLRSLSQEVDLLAKVGLVEVEGLQDVNAGNKDENAEGWGSSYPNILAAFYTNLLMVINDKEADDITRQNSSGSLEDKINFSPSQSDLSLFNLKLPFLHPSPLPDDVDIASLPSSYLFEKDGKKYYTGFSCGFDMGGSRLDDNMNGEFKHYDGSSFTAAMTSSPVPFATIHLKWHLTGENKEDPYVQEIKKSYSIIEPQNVEPGDVVLICYKDQDGKVSQTITCSLVLSKNGGGYDTLNCTRNFSDTEGMGTSRIEEKKGHDLVFFRRNEESPDEILPEFGNMEDLLGSLDQELSTMGLNMDVFDSTD